MIGTVELTYSVGQKISCIKGINSTNGVGNDEDVCLGAGLGAGLGQIANNGGIRVEKIYLV